MDPVSEPNVLQGVVGHLLQTNQDLTFCHDNSIEVLHHVMETLMWRPASQQCLLETSLIGFRLRGHLGHEVTKQALVNPNDFIACYLEVFTLDDMLLLRKEEANMPSVGAAALASCLRCMMHCYRQINRTDMCNCELALTVCECQPNEACSQTAHKALKPPLHAGNVTADHEKWKLCMQAQGGCPCRAVQEHC